MCYKVKHEGYSILLMYLISLSFPSGFQVKDPTLDLCFFRKNAGVVK